MYGFGAEGVVMKLQSHLSVSSRPSTVDNYDAREMAMKLNESAIKAADEARQKEIQDLDKQVAKEMRAKEAKFENELAQEKAVKQQDKEKLKSKISKLWMFFKNQQARSSTAPPNTNPSEDDDKDEPNPSDLGDSSHD